jgi:hypothetical protein
MVRDKQLRLVFSLLKPALRMAARFHVPVRAIVELVRLGYYELLSRQGMVGAEIAEVFGQSPRHMRSLAHRLKSDFFAAEAEVGIVRDVEEAVAVHAPTRAELPGLLPAAEPERVESALAQLLGDERVEMGADGHLRTGRRFVVMASDAFHHRIDALNHHLDAVYQATAQRLVFDERTATMIKTITFSAAPQELDAYLKKLEGDLRRDLAAMEESVSFSGKPSQRFTVGISASAAAPGGTLEEP